MTRHLVPVTMTAAMFAFAVAALTAASTPYRPGAWTAAVTLAVLGGITPMIYAVNIRIVPVFSRRAWSAQPWLAAQVGLALAGAWLSYAGRLGRLDTLTTLGSALALLGALVFLGNLAGLMRQAPATPAPPLPFPLQTEVDRLATRFTRLAALYLVVGLTIGLITSVWRPDFGRWELVWAHAMLVGFFLSMAAGVCYHVLSRWTGRPWRSATPIRLHLLAVTIGLPLMLLALATDQLTLFAIAGTLQAAAVLLFLATVGPLVPALPGLTRQGVAAAAVLLLAGVCLGAWFALDPAAGARLRLAHAGLNLFGWGGLLISGVGYYLVPRFAGQPQRWPRLASVQVGVLASGVVLGVLATLWRVYGDGPAWAVLATQTVVALGFALLGLLIAGTFYQRSRWTAASVPIIPRPAHAQRPTRPLPRA